MYPLCIVVLNVPLKIGSMLDGHHSIRGESYELLEDKVILKDKMGYETEFSKNIVETIYQCTYTGGIKMAYPNIEPLKCPDCIPDLAQVPNSEENAVNEESVHGNTENGSNAPLNAK